MLDASLSRWLRRRRQNSRPATSNNTRGMPSPKPSPKPRPVSLFGDVFAEPCEPFDVEDAVAVAEDVEVVCDDTTDDVPEGL